VQRLIVICAVAMTLTGCTTRQEREAQVARNIDTQDDIYCRKQASHTPNAATAYAQCRQRLLQVRQADAQNAAMSAASMPPANVGNSIQQAGVALQAINPPPPTTCTSTPWVGGIRTTCQQ
jgi:hypothetical protein